MADKQPPTEYVVLKRTVEDDSVWKEYKPQQARSAEEAIRKATDLGVRGHEEGVYKAIPMRSWKQSIRIRTQQVAQSAFEDVGTPPVGEKLSNSSNASGDREAVSA